MLSRFLMLEHGASPRLVFCLGCSQNWSGPEKELGFIAIAVPQMAAGGCGRSEKSSEGGKSPRLCRMYCGGE